MKAAVLFKYKEPLKVMDNIELDPPKEGEVRIKVEATGMCHSDVTSSSVRLQFLHQ